MGDYKEKIEMISIRFSFSIEEYCTFSDSNGSGQPDSGYLNQMWS